eukprot:gnl/Trimastix_PCT/3107.p1 GENE.gnl/Trimastix_PCT/3107~~gnl/Trimastix_PCT/3107.p1  ORF type:complete len:386 (+),score=92.21 gnl/Trimastix_PCT/3107:118-1275(+)
MNMAAPLTEEELQILQSILEEEDDPSIKYTQEQIDAVMKTLNEVEVAVEEDDEEDITAKRDEPLGIEKILLNLRHRITLPPTLCHQPLHNRNLPFSEVLRFDLKERISGSVNQYRGSPTCIRVQRKFVAVGTDQGTVLIYDHFESHKATLQPNKPLGRVLTMDMDRRCEFLVTGHESGALVFWDMNTQQSLKVIENAFPVPVVHVVLLPNQRAAIASSVDGTTTCFRLQKRAFLTTVSTNMIYGGGMGQVVSLAVDSTESDKDESMKDCLIALSTRTTMLVLTANSVQIVHKQQKPEWIPEEFLPVVTFRPPSSRVNEMPVVAWALGNFLLLFRIRREITGKMCEFHSFPIGEYTPPSQTPLDTLYWLPPAAAFFSGEGGGGRPT